MLRTIGGLCSLALIVLSVAIFVRMAAIEPWHIVAFGVLASVSICSSIWVIVYALARYLSSRKGGHDATPETP